MTDGPPRPPFRRPPPRAPLHPRVTVRPNGEEQIVVPPYAANQRLDAFLSKYAEGRSRTEWQRLISTGAVTLDNRLPRPSDRVSPGQWVRIHILPATTRTDVKPAADIPLTVMYQDPAMIVVNKPAGLVVHPAPGHAEGTLVNALLARFPDLADPTGQHRPGIVHRLDKDTSGLIVVGRTTAAMAALSEQFRNRTAHKHYLLLVKGDLPEEEAAIEAPIGRDVRDRKRMAARAEGREARTQFTVLERYGDFTLVDADLQSGRTHQLRVHFQFIGHPVAGDRTYGNVRGPAGQRRQFVHAASLRLSSPHDGVVREFRAPLPNDLRSPLERLRAQHGYAPESLPAIVLGQPPVSGGSTATVTPEVLPIPGAHQQRASGRAARGGADGERPASGHPIERRQHGEGQTEGRRSGERPTEPGRGHTGPARDSSGPGRGRRGRQHPNTGRGS
ncbi:MAG: RluA family pseudouridine synthase [Chloroflexi bacterium]|nr:RluA family pseudouridine synthase [Chloroflexota bacterium]